jgi:hypothetical protein
VLLWSAPALLQLCSLSPALAEEGQQWVGVDSDQLSPGLPYSIRYPYGWKVNQVLTQNQTRLSRWFGEDRRNSDLAGECGLCS